MNVQEPWKYETEKVKTYKKTMSLLSLLKNIITFIIKVDQRKAKGKIKKHLF